MSKKIKVSYRADYKTDDPNWWTPTNRALLGNNVAVEFKRLNEQAKIPQYKTAQAAGMDVASVEQVVLPSGKFTMVGTGLAMALPDGYEAQVRPRSGLAAKYGVTVLNAPGTIDADYRGEIKVILINHGPEDFKIEIGDRIAQLVIKKVEQLKVFEVEKLDDTERGTGGFGSTGVK